MVVPFSDYLGVVIPFPPSLCVTFSFLAKMPETVFCLSLLCSQMAGGLLAGLKGKAQGCDGKSARPFRPSCLMHHQRMQQGARRRALGSTRA